MAGSLTLAVESPGHTPEPSENGSILTIDEDSPVTVVATTAPAGSRVTRLTLLWDDEALGTQASTGANGTHTWQLEGDRRFGAFRATAEIDGVRVESGEVLVVQAHPGGSAGMGGCDPGADDQPSVGAPGGHDAAVVAEPGHPVAENTPGQAEGATTESQGVVELAAGEYDARFARWVGVIFAGLALAVVATVSFQVLGAIDWSAAPDATAAGAAGGTGGGTFAERTRLAVAGLLVAVGGVLLLAGAALAALEVRGRQRVVQGTGVRTRGAAEVLDKVPVILQRAGLLRGTIAVLITGGLMLLLAVVMLVGLRGLGTGPQA
jgi:hypothetical protein